MLLLPTQAAWQGAKDARAQLAKVAADTQVNIQVARQTRRKHAFTAIMELLNKLHQAAQLRTSLRCGAVRCLWACSVPGDHTLADMLAACLPVSMAGLWWVSCVRPSALGHLLPGAADSCSLFEWLETQALPNNWRPGKMSASCAQRSAERARMLLPTPAGRHRRMGSTPAPSGCALSAAQTWSRWPCSRSRSPWRSP